MAETRVGSVRVSWRGTSLIVRRRAFANVGRILWSLNLLLFVSAVPLGLVFGPFAFFCAAGAIASATSLTFAMVVGAERAAEPGLVVLRQSLEVRHESKGTAEGYRDAVSPEAMCVLLNGCRIAERVLDVRIHERIAPSSTHRPSTRVLYVVFETRVVLVTAVLDGSGIDRLHDQLRSALGLPSKPILTLRESPPVAAYLWPFALAFPHLAVVFGGSFGAFYLAERPLEGDLAMQTVAFVVASAAGLGATVAFTALMASVLRKSMRAWVQDTFGIRPRGA